MTPTENIEGDQEPTNK